MEKNIPIRKVPDFFNRARDYFKHKLQKRRFDAFISYKKNYKYFNKLYLSIDGYQVFKMAVTQQAYNYHVYGEINFYSFAALLSMIKPTVDDVFVDLGSGTGKACLTAALAFNVHCNRGIEIVPQLHQLALDVYQQCEASLQKKLSFICDDYLNQSLQDATIIFINATALFGDDWLKVENHLIDQLPINARVLVSSKQLSDKHFKYLGIRAVMMDYGLSHVSSYQKIN